MISDFVLELANAPGTSATVNLAGAVTDRRSFASAFSSGAAVFYFMDDGSQAEWGVGTFSAGSPNTLSRDTVLGNTASTTSRLNFGASVRVYNEIPAGRSLYIDNTGAIASGGGGSGTIGTMAGGVPIGSGTEFWGTSAPAGWLFAAGQAVSRTTYAKLFAVIGITYGAGDGSTTFNLPDKRGRVSVSKDDMLGSAAARVTTAGSGVDGTTLGAAGGDQLTQAHSHGTTQSAHSHGTTESPHAHGTTEPPHSHTAVAAPHSHTIQTGASASGHATIDNLTQPGTGGTVSTDLATAGVTVNSASTGLTVNSASTGLTVNSASITLTVNSAGGGAGQNLQPSIVCNYIIFAGA